MNIRSLIQSSFLAFSLMFTSAATAQELNTVDFVDVERYLGKWYEIARLPQVFQTGCTAVTAEYSLNEDGSVKVVNNCRLFSRRFGLPIQITGRAVPADETNSKLDVTFFDGRAEGDYWVLELDDNYQWAMVGDRERSSLYILSRDSVLDDEVYNSLLDLAVSKHNYDISKLIKTRQVRK